MVGWYENERQKILMITSHQGRPLAGVESLLHRVLPSTLSPWPVSSVFTLELAILPYWEAESWGLTYLSIEMKRLFYVIWVDLNSITDVFDDGGRGRFDTGSRCHVTTEAGVQVVDSQPGAPTATQACINLRQSSHRASGVRFWLALLTPLFRVSEL